MMLKSSGESMHALRRVHSLLSCGVSEGVS